MPFDGTSYERPLKALDKIDQVIQLLGDERRWCKRELETDDGRRCIVGALIAVDAATLLKEPIRCAIEQVTGEYYLKVEAFNDHPQTTHSLVVRVLDQARANIANADSLAPHFDHVPPTRFWRNFR
jgi:hypothetical protein